MTTPEQNRMNSRLDALRAQFIERCRGELAALEAFARQDDLGADDRTALAGITHRLAGAGGTFGYPELSVCATRLETLLNAEPPRGGDQHVAVAELLRELRRLTGSR